eukprot:scaffold6706_cov95-Skeletonema_marinoi.AAC.3
MAGRREPIFTMVMSFRSHVKSIEVYVGIGSASKARPKHSAFSHTIGLASGETFPGWWVREVMVVDKGSQKGCN